MRDALIEAMARALSYERAREVMFAESETARQLYVDKRWSDWVANATVALNAALSLLESPTDDMVEAGIEHLFGWAHDDPKVDARMIFVAMLSTLRSPEK